MPFRALAVLLAVQVVLGAAFVAWTLSGFPLIGGGSANDDAKRSAGPRAASRSLDTAGEAVLELLSPARRSGGA